MNILKYCIIIVLFFSPALFAETIIYLRLFKLEKTLEIWIKEQGNTYKLKETYPICHYSGGLGPKQKQGDKKSPEGFYATNLNLLNPNSNYHLSFNIGYPNHYDRAHGYTGDFIMIHGSCVSIGCYAMTDRIIEKIYQQVEQALKGGQTSIPIHIFPFRMTNNAMKLATLSKYYQFWLQLKPAYDYFENTRMLPEIKVVNKRYYVNQ